MRPTLSNASTAPLAGVSGVVIIVIQLRQGPRLALHGRILVHLSAPCAAYVAYTFAVICRPTRGLFFLRIGLPTWTRWLRPPCQGADFRLSSGDVERSENDGCWGCGLGEG